MIRQHGPKLKGEIAVFASGALLGFFAIVFVGCRSTCGQEDCPAPIEVASGVYKATSEIRSFEETTAPTQLPNLSAAMVAIDAESKKVTLTYTDSMGEPVRVTFMERADAGGAGEGGS